MRTAGLTGDLGFIPGSTTELDWLLNIDIPAASSVGCEKSFSTQLPVIHTDGRSIIIFEKNLFLS